MINKLKKIIVIIIILIIIICSMLIINKNDNNNYNEKIEFNNQANDYLLVIDYSIEEIKSIPTFQTINNCVNLLIKYNIENNSEALKSIYIKDYLEDNKNVKINKMSNEETEYMIRKVYRYEASHTVKTYFIQGYILNKNNKTTESFDLLLNFDYKNNSFELAPLDGIYNNYIDYSDFNNIKIKDKSINNKIIEIEPNKYNTVDMDIVMGIRRKTNYGILF